MPLHALSYRGTRRKKPPRYSDTDTDAMCTFYDACGRSTTHFSALDGKPTGNARANTMKNIAAKQTRAESDAGSPERRGEGTARQLTFEKDATRTPTVAGEDASPVQTNQGGDEQETPPTADTTMGSASSFSATPGSCASVHFEDTFQPPSDAEVTEMSPTEADAHISEIGRALSEACEKAGCHVGQLWVAMPRSSLRDLFKLLLKLSELT